MGENIARPSKYPVKHGKLSFPETLTQLNQVTERNLLNILSRITVQDGKLVLDGKVIEPEVGETINTFGLVGKWFEDGDGFSTHYTGSSVVATVTGTTRVTGQFQHTGSSTLEQKSIAVRINRGNWKRYALTNSVVIAEGLNPSSSHLIEIVYDGWNQEDKLWENQRKFSIVSLGLDDGGSLWYTNSKKNILFIGDSITAGTRTINGTDSATGSSAVLSYARILADRLNANPYHNGFAGKKVQDPFMKENVKLVSAGKPVPDYNIHSIVIMMGTNDYQYPSNDFIREYQLLIDSVRDVYANQRIYVLGLFENDPSNRRNSELNTIAQNNANVKFIDTSNLSGVQYTDGLHPSGTGSQTIVEFLYPLFIADGWTGTPNPQPDPQPEPEPDIPTTNLWTDNGKPTSYDPLPSGFHSIPLPASYAGHTFKLSFKAKSATGKNLNMYNDYRADFTVDLLTLTPTLTPYEYTFTVTYDTADNNFFHIKRADMDIDNDIVIQDISLVMMS